MTKMQTQQTTPNRFHKLEGYYLIPHELLHVLAYRLLDKPYLYRWGDHRVKSTAKQTQRERVFILLLPTILCWGVALLSYVMWGILALSAHMPPETYFVAGPKWHWALAFCGYRYTVHHLQWDWLSRHKTNLADIIWERKIATKAPQST